MGAICVNEPVKEEITVKNWTVLVVVVLAMAGMFTPGCTCRSPVVWDDKTDANKAPAATPAPEVVELKKQVADLQKQLAAKPATPQVMELKLPAGSNIGGNAIAVVGDSEAVREAMAAERRLKTATETVKASIDALEQAKKAEEAKPVDARTAEKILELDVQIEKEQDHLDWLETELVGEINPMADRGKSLRAQKAAAKATIKSLQARRDKLAPKPTPAPTASAESPKVGDILLKLRAELLEAEADLAAFKKTAAECGDPNNGPRLQARVQQKLREIELRKAQLAEAERELEKTMLAPSESETDKPAVKPAR